MLFRSDRTLLHFEAVDYRTEVFLNGKKVGEHVGGNTAFSIDLTSSLRADAPNELVVRVDDDTEASQLRGKQVLFPGGIWYTQVSGIWQTVWMETVPQISIRDLKITTDADRGVIRVGAILRNPTPDSAQNASDLSLRVRLSLKGKPIESISVAQGNGAAFRIQDPQLWSPSSPILYDISVDLLDRDGKILDSVKSYAGLRTVGKKKDENGHCRLTLNGEILFH